ncbi:MAG: hypothetical protein IJ833_00020 [Lachnospiraceae bacterium]|nr:hypothetical protein [Lachnospiraceae bacterium]
MRQKAGDPEHQTGEKKIQFIIAAVCTMLLVVGIPVYAWFKSQREIARFERIDAPDVLFITAAHAEDSIYLKMGGIDVKANWKNGDGTNAGQMLYIDYVFAVAGEYVPQYTLQMAHTTNNQYTYEIYEAAVTTEEPASNKVEGRDYIIYAPKNDWASKLPDSLKKPAGSTLYYSVGTKVNGAYLNQDNTTKLAEGTYHDLTYEYSKYSSEADSRIEIHSEPLYWQKTGISVTGDKTPFYHEYILRIKWDAEASKEYKDTDIICITAKAD